MSFIEWCNQNVGFASLVLSALTLIVSIVAIIVSIHTARLPYKKKMLITSGSCISPVKGMDLYITITNIGNRNVTIKNVGYLIGKMVYINPYTISESQIMLQHSETTTQYYSRDDLKKKIREYKIPSWRKIKVLIEDTEGKRYKKNLLKVGQFIK